MIVFLASVVQSSNFAVQSKLLKNIAVKATAKVHIWAIIKLGILYYGSPCLQYTVQSKVG